jgi:competence protein ComEC
MFHLSLGLALTLVAGLTGGVLVDTPLTLPLTVGLATGWGATTLGFFAQRPRLQLGGFVMSVFAAGWLLGGDALDRALYSPLRTILEQRLGGFSIDVLGDAPATDPIRIEGRLREDAALSETGATLRIEVTRVWVGPCPEPATGGVSVGVGGALQSDHVGQWTAGRVIRAPVLLRRPARYLNEGLPDQERALARRGITLVGTIKSAALVELVDHAPWWDEAAARVRAQARRALARHVGPADARAAAMATAILIGDRAGLDAETSRRLQEAGTYHVIAISGGNIAILAGLMLGTFALVGLRGRLAALGAIAALTAYASIAAGGASVARATLMATVYLAVRLIDQRTAAANAIGLSAAVLLLLNPLSIADVGFWLTFGATSAIVLGVTRVTMPAGSLPRILVTVLLASACAELALAPVSALVFQRVTLAGLVLNFAALPAMTVVQLGALAVVAFDAMGLGGLAGLAGRFVHAGGVVLTDSANLLDLAPWLTWRVPPPLVVVLAGYYLSLALAGASGHVARIPRVLRNFAGVGAAALFLWVVAAPQARVRANGDGRLHLVVIDVGQGDAMLVTFPDGRRLAVDSGGASPRSQFDVGDRVVGPSLRARNLVALDYLAVTHGDPDHIGGARSLVRDFQPAEIWWGIAVANHEPAALLRGEAARARSAWRTLQRGDRLEIGGVELRVHHPPLPDWERQKVRNDDSLVMELRYGEVSMLLTGDIGREVERELLPALDLLPTVVLKVAHHGSGTSSAAEFVERVKPSIALVGVGRANPYGHPVPYVLERLQNAGAEVFRTDLEGQIYVSTDGKALEVMTYTGRSWNKSKR